MTVARGDRSGDATPGDRWRFWQRPRIGTSAMLVQRVPVIAEAMDELDREVSADSSLVRVHQHAAGARTRVVHTGGQRIRARPQRTV